MAISQRISLEGSEDIRQKLEALSKAVAKMGDDSAAGFKRASTEATRLGVQIGVVSGAVQVLTNKFIELAAAARQALSPSELVKGTAATGKALKDQADQVNLTIAEWMKLAKATDAAGVSQETVSAGIAKVTKKIADAKGGFVELVPGSFVSTSQGAVTLITNLAKAISTLGTSEQATRAGIAAFGENWKEIVKVLTGSKAAADAADSVIDKLARVDRAISPEQAEKAAQLAKGWDVLAKSIRAFKDQVGTVFIDSALTKAEWLIKLIDGSRELFKTWQALGEEKKKAFLEGLGDSPAETAFTALVTTGRILAGIWNNVLVPAGQKLAEIVLQLKGGFGEVSKGEVVGFFVALAAAAVGLAIALKGVALVLGPLMLLFSPLGAILLAAATAAAFFWDEMKQGAETVGALIPQQLQDMAASFQKLFSGDFAGFWTQFSSAAISAFDVIKQALSQLVADTPWAQTLLDGIKQIAIDAPGAIKLVAEAFIALGNAATTVANVINTIFGTELTGTGVALLVIVTSMTGGLVALASIATICGVAIGAVASAVTIFGGEAVAVVAGIAALAVGLTALVNNFDAVKAGAIAFFKGINDGIDFVIAKIGELAVAAGGAIWDAFKSAGGAAIDFVIGKVNNLIDLIKSVGGAIAGAFSGGGGGGPAAGSIPGNAAGGLIGGRGTGTSDSNLAWVSRGEHIMPARAVRQPGVLALLEALRRTGGNMRGVMNGMGRFAGGGLIPRFAEGGLVGGGMGHLGTVDLRIDGGTVRMMAGASAVEQLSRLAVTRRMTSTGKKPGFVG